MKLPIIVLVSVGLVSCAPPEPQGINTDDAREILLAHDCCGRAEDSKIVKLGDAVFDDRVVSVFSLDFVNPQNLRSTQHIAFLENGTLLGSYPIDGMPEASIEGSQVEFKWGGANPGSTRIDLIDPLPQTVFIDGAVYPISNSI